MSTNKTLQSNAAIKIVLDELLDGVSVTQVRSRRTYVKNKMEEIETALLLEAVLPKKTVNKLKAAKPCYEKELGFLDKITEMVEKFEEKGEVLPRDPYYIDKPNHAYWDDDEDIMGGEGLAGTNVSVFRS